jgi:hypothetical protein
VFIAGLVIVGLAVAGGLLVVVYTLWYGISPMPTSLRVRRVLLGMLPADPGGPVVELGAGWGSLAFPLARRWPGRPVTAYEVSPVPWLFMRLRLAVRPCPNLRIVRRDFFRDDLSGTTLAVCYLYRGAMRRLRAKFETELPAGAMVLTHTFAVPGWLPETVVRAGDLYRTPVYRYRTRG